MEEGKKAGKFKRRLSQEWGRIFKTGRGSILSKKAMVTKKAVFEHGIVRPGCGGNKKDRGVGRDCRS